MFKHIAAVSVAALVPGLDREHHMGRTRYIGGRRCTNRFRPHNGAREIARRQRQRARDIANQEARANVSCFVTDGVQKALPDGCRVSRRRLLMEVS